MKFDKFDQITKSIVVSIKKYIDDKFKELDNKKEQYNPFYDIVDFEENKTYKKGQIIKYNGGLIIAKQDTIRYDIVKDDDSCFDKILKCGFDVLVCGFHGVDYSFNDETRTLQIKTFSTDCIFTDEIEIPYASDFGVYKEDEVYSKGAMVTFKGSLWIAKRSTEVGEKPGDCDAFRLAVKSGSVKGD